VKALISLADPEKRVSIMKRAALGPYAIRKTVSREKEPLSKVYQLRGRENKAQARFTKPGKRKRGTFKGEENDAFILKGIGQWEGT